MTKFERQKQNLINLLERTNAVNVLTAVEDCNLDNEEEVKDLLLLNAAVRTVLYYNIGNSDLNSKWYKKFNDLACEYGKLYLINRPRTYLANWGNDSTAFYLNN